MEFQEFDEPMLDAEREAYEESVLRRLSHLLKWYRDQEIKYKAAAETAIQKLMQEEFPEEDIGEIRKQIENSLIQQAQYHSERCDLMSVLIALQRPYAVTPEWHITFWGFDDIEKALARRRETIDLLLCGKFDQLKGERKGDYTVEERIALVGKMFRPGLVPQDTGNKPNVPQLLSPRSDARRGPNPTTGLTVLQGLRKALDEGRYTIDQLRRGEISQEALAAEFRCSRTPVIEALRELLSTDV